MVQKVRHNINKHQSANQRMNLPKYSTTVCDLEDRRSERILRSTSEPRTDGNCHRSGNRRSFYRGRFNYPGRLWPIRPAANVFLLSPIELEPTFEIGPWKFNGVQGSRLRSGNAQCRNSFLFGQCVSGRHLT